MKGLDDSGVKAVEIASRMQIALSTFYKLKQTDFRYKERETREPLLDSDEEYKFVEAAEANRDLTAVDLARDEALNTNGVCVSTVKNILNKYGLKSRRKRKMQAMSEDNKEERFKMSRNFRRWSKQRL
jgi:transposase